MFLFSLFNRNRRFISLAKIDNAPRKNKNKRILASEFWQIEKAAFVTNLFVFFVIFLETIDSLTQHM